MNLIRRQIRRGGGINYMSRVYNIICVGVRVGTYTASVQYNSNIINDYVMISGHAPVRM